MDFSNVVKAGIELLESKGVDLDKINLDKLNQRKCTLLTGEGCVLCWIFGDWHTGLEKLGLTWADFEYGFALKPTNSLDANKYYPELTNEWILQLTAKREQPFNDNQLDDMSSLKPNLSYKREIVNENK